MSNLIPSLMAAGTLVMQVLALITISLFVASHFFKAKIPFFRTLYIFLARYNYLIIFVLTFISSIASLVLSEILKLPPCVLCWYQRVFMYPQPIMLYLATVRNEKILDPYLIALNGVGALIALYHTIMLMLPKGSLLPCANTGGISCTEGYQLYFGYITIPVMSLTVFIINILLLTIKDTHFKKQ